MRDPSEPETEAGGDDADHDQGAALEGDSGLPRVGGAEDREAAALLLAPDQRSADRDRGGVPPSGGAPHIRKRRGCDQSGPGSGRQGGAGFGAGKAGARPQAAEGADQGPQEEERPHAPEGGRAPSPSRAAPPEGRGGGGPLASQAPHPHRGSGGEDAASIQGAGPRLLGAG